MNIRERKKGFTLIELLIVITIIGILAVTFLPSLLGSPGKARDMQRIQALRKLSGLVIGNNLTLPMTHCWDGTSGISLTVQNSYLSQLGGVLPKDPVTTNLSMPSGCGSVVSPCAGSYFSINCNGFPNISFIAHMENPSDGNSNGDPSGSPCDCFLPLGNSGNYYVLKIQK